METKIQRLKDTIFSLEHHFDKYLEHKWESKNASRKADRDRATKNMISSAEYIENLLTRDPAYAIIKGGSQFQFEDFWKYVQSDVPDYLQALKAHLETLEINDSEK